MEPTETSSSTETKLERIAWLSAVDPGKVFNQVMHHFNLDSLLQWALLRKIIVNFRKVIFLCSLLRIKQLIQIIYQ
ncbi:hypothetical protein Psal027_03434 (plasmid) [Piscirickettsia salmonis]|nr:hypothetical protein Psal001_03393 [Piscirickettsia salmonis]QGN82714.1 hypothetical protein Psal002_03412 [Piscirickettsia salmonis]QGN86227.1 hypothetical protein Psal003_03334 [Piscirickettsia salmonis]QGN89731.1 hypothetical protein Psal004_03324 [Piscirickettsia salmonis]QGN93375.1 hypothetical protein Psal005_03466 [Piscirickettsia salmonis]